MHNNKRGPTQGELPPQPATHGPYHGQCYAASDDPTKIAGALIIVITVLILLFLWPFWADCPNRKVGKLARKIRAQRTMKPNGAD